MTNDPEDKKPPVPPQADKPDGPSAPPSTPAINVTEKPAVAGKPAAEKPASAPSAPAAGTAPPVTPPATAAKPAAPAAVSGAPAKPAGAVPPKPAAPAKPAAPPPPKEGPVPLDNELVQRLKARFGDAIKEAVQDRKQAIVLVAADKLREISRYCRDDEKFNMLDDLTAVDWPKREKRFDVVLILYSFSKNERLRLKVHAAENEPVPSVCEFWPVANWLERECYDMFGIRFRLVEDPLR